MAESRGSIPRKDADFDKWVENFVNYVRANALCVGPPPKWTNIPQAVVQELIALYGIWHAAYEKTFGPHTRVDTYAKNEARKNLTVLVRIFIKRYLQYSPVTDDDRVAMGVHIADPARTQIGARVTRALLSLLKVLGGFQLELRFHDELLTAGHAIPYGCKGCLLLYDYGDEKITDYTLLKQSVLMTKSIYILSLGPEAEGKHFSCALCWVSTRGKRGPLSEIYHTIVL